MEISPIPGIRSQPVIKTPPVDANVSRVFDVENSARPDDDTYSGSNKKGAGGQDDEDETTEETDELDAFVEIQPAESANRDAPEHGTEDRATQEQGVNFFA